MLKVTKENVLRELKRTNAGKAAGPDRIKPGLLKTCARQLCSILCVIFLSARSLLCGKPLPVPKKTTVKAMSDLRPVALTSAVMKVFERVVQLSQTPSWRQRSGPQGASCNALLLIFSTLCSLHTGERGEWKMLFCMFCITYILIWTNLVPTSVSCFWTFLAHSI